MIMDDFHISLGNRCFWSSTAWVTYGRAGPTSGSAPFWLLNSWNRGVRPVAWRFWGMMATAWFQGWWWYWPLLVTRQLHLRMEMNQYDISDERVNDWIDNWLDTWSAISTFGVVMSSVFFMVALCKYIYIHILKYIIKQYLFMWKHHEENKTFAIDSKTK